MTKLEQKKKNFVKSKSLEVYAKIKSPFREILSEKLDTAHTLYPKIENLKK